MRYRGLTMGRTFTGDFLCADAERHEVRRCTLLKSGATFTATAEPFVSSSDPDFRPSDVLEDADGSVLVVDAGGAIYRLRRDYAVRIGDARGLKLKWDHPPVTEMVRRLHDLRPCVAERAADELGRSGSEAVAILNDTLTRTTNADARLYAVWALARSTAASAPIPLRAALVDPSPPVRQAAAYALGLRRDADAIQQLVAALSDDSPAVRREAANALGRIGNPAVAAPMPPGAGAAPGQNPQGMPTVVVGGQGDVRFAPAPAAAPAPVAEGAAAPATAPAKGPGPTTAPAPAAPVAAVVPTRPSPAVPALLNVLRGGGADRFLEHAVVYALVRINDRPSTSRALTDPDPDVQRGAKMALDAMTSGAPAPQE
jgi:hypothetical protein